VSRDGILIISLGFFKRRDENSSLSFFCISLPIVTIYATKNATVEAKTHKEESKHVTPTGTPGPLYKREAGFCISEQK
jgi:hypothetical protein